MPAPGSTHSVDSLISYPLVDIIAHQNMNPNVITITNIIPGILSLYFLIKGNYFLFYTFLVIRILLDCLDGHVARKYSKETELGNKLDMISDFIYYGALILVILRRASHRTKAIYIAAFVWLYIHKPKYLFSTVHDNTLLAIPLMATLLIVTQW